MHANAPFPCMCMHYSSFVLDTATQMKTWLSWIDDLAKCLGHKRLQRIPRCVVGVYFYRLIGLQPAGSSNYRTESKLDRNLLARTNMHQMWKLEIFGKFRGLSVVKNGVTTLCWKLKHLIFQPTRLKIRLPRLVHADRQCVNETHAQWFDWWNQELQSDLQ